MLKVSSLFAFSSVSVLIKAYKLIAFVLLLHHGNKYALLYAYAKRSITDRDQYEVRR